MKRFPFFETIMIIAFMVAISESTSPTKRSEMASTFLDGKIYVTGGINFWGSNNRFESYDTGEDTWERLPDLPKRLNHMGLASYQGRIYMSGGFFNAIQTKYSNSLYVYDIQEAKWSKLSELPSERAAHIMIHRDGYLHLIGGVKHEAIWSYNLETLDWEMDAIAPLPEKRDHINILQDDTKLYLVGGRQQGIVKKDCWEYDFENRQWQVFADLATPRGGQSACIYDQKIHIIGGEDLEKKVTYSQHDIFDLKEQKWHQGEDLKIARHGFISECLEGQWYIYGGGRKANIKTVFTTTNDLEIINLNTLIGN